MARGVAGGIPPGGIPLAMAKRAAEQALWARVALQRAVETRRYGGAGRPRPAAVPATDVLGSRAEWQAAVAECRRLRLPRHHDRPKNWDALGAVSVLLDCMPVTAAVLDAGSARYSPVLPWLRLYGFTDLTGLNLEFGREVRRGPVRFRYGDITATDLPTGALDAVTCMSVIEHGVPISAFLAETARVLRPGGVLVLSTDYDRNGVDTSGKTAYGVPVHIFSAVEIERLVADAAALGLRLRRPLRLDHTERPVHWPRQQLDYTFIRLTFDRLP